MNTREKLLTCLEENGVTVDADGTCNLIDSLHLISSILRIEEEFDIEFSGVMIANINFWDFDDLLMTVEKMIEQQM